MKEYKFPKDFIWGVAGGSYQIEGAWNEDGKGESIWDRFAHIPGNIANDDTGDIACDFYHRYKEDISLMKKFGIQSFLSTISWPRVIPDGTGAVNKKGIEYYRNMLQCLRENGIKSYVVLYHWDLPQALQNRGGWMNRESVLWFENYARTMYKELGDLVDHWITILEPWVSCFMGYYTGEHAPGLHDFSAALQTVHYQLMAHGAAVKAFRETGLKGEIGIKIVSQMVYPKNPQDAADVAAAQRFDSYYNLLFCDPLYLGEYPQELFCFLKKKGVVLPAIQPGDMELISQKFDFFGLNNYNGIYIKKGNSWPLECEQVKSGKPETQYGWECDPDAFYDIVRYINDRYHPNQILITENGAASNDWVDSEGKVEDPLRKEFLKQYLIRLHRAIEEGINVTGYHVWSFWDVIEWSEGFTKSFGLTHIDRKTLDRIPKSSLYWYSEIIKNNGFSL